MSPSGDGRGLFFRVSADTIGGGKPKLPAFSGLARELLFFLLSATL